MNHSTASVDFRPLGDPSSHDAFTSAAKALLAFARRRPQDAVWVCVPNREAGMRFREALSHAHQSQSVSLGVSMPLALAGFQVLTPYGLLQKLLTLLWPLIEGRLSQAYGGLCADLTHSWVTRPESNPVLLELAFHHVLTQHRHQAALASLNIKPSQLKRYLLQSKQSLLPRYGQAGVVDVPNGERRHGERSPVSPSKSATAASPPGLLALTQATDSTSFRLRQFLPRHGLRILQRLLHEDEAAIEAVKAACQVFYPIGLLPEAPSDAASASGIILPLLTRLSELAPCQMTPYYAPIQPDLDTFASHILGLQQQCRLTVLNEPSRVAMIGALRSHCETLSRDGVRAEQVEILCPSWDATLRDLMLASLSDIWPEAQSAVDKTGVELIERPVELALLTLFHGVMTSLESEETTPSRLFSQTAPSVSSMANVLTLFEIGTVSQRLDFLSAFAGAAYSGEAAWSFCFSDTAKGYFKDSTSPESFNQSSFETLCEALKRLTQKRVLADDVTTLFYTLLSDLVYPRLRHPYRLSQLASWIEAFRGVPLLVALDSPENAQPSAYDVLETQAALYRLLLDKIATRPEAPGRSSVDETSSGVMLRRPDEALNHRLSSQAAVRPVQIWLDIAHSDWERLAATGWLAYLCLPSISDSERPLDSIETKPLLPQLGVLRCGVDSAGQTYSQDWSRYVFSADRSVSRAALEDIDVEGVASLVPLRRDQAQIQRYEYGPMAILAPPGSGKTYLVVALALQAIQRGVASEQILILTYMDSAVRTIQSRLAAVLPKHVVLPEVSTIHGLAYRILETYRLHWSPLSQDRIAEESVDDGQDATPWASAWNMQDGFRLSILDDAQQLQWLELVLRRFQQTSDSEPTEASSLRQNSRLLLRALLRLKAMGVSPVVLRAALERSSAGFRRLREVLPVYEAYQTLLAREGVLDYTDLLVEAIRALQQTPDFAAEMAKQWALVIEDEAQDSSILMQTLLGLLVSPHGCFVRTGDPNQAITGSFSAAEPTNFREFMAQSASISLTQSGRSALEIQHLANAFLKHCLDDTVLSNAFVSAELTPVPGQNPSLYEPISWWRAESLSEQRERILEAVRQDWRKAHEAHRGPWSLAILCRHNASVAEWSRYLKQAGLPAEAQGDFPLLDPVFSLLARTFMLLATPWDSALQDVWVEQLTELGYYVPSLLDDSEQSEEAIEPVDDTDRASSKIVASPFFSAYPVRALFESLMASQAFPRVVAAKLIRDVFQGEEMALTTLSLIDTTLSRWQVEFYEEQMRHVTSESFLDRVAKRLKQALDSKRYPYKAPASLEASDSRESSLPKIWVMTAHRAKGQEFDVVYVPSITEETYTGDGKWLWIDETDRLEAEIRYLEVIQSGQRYDIPTFKTHLTSLAQAKLEEEARLLYVAMTRAKEKLVLSTVHDPAQAGRVRGVTASRLFYILESILTQAEQASVSVSKGEGY